MSRAIRTLTAVAASSLFLVVLVGCDPGGAGSSCSVVEMEDGSVEILCEDGSTAVMEPPRATVFPGPTTGGNDEPMTCTAVEETDGSFTVTCPDGSEFTVEDGRDGRDGTSCTIVEEAGQSILRCDDGSETVLPDPIAGQDGQDGEPGQDGQDGSSCTIVQENGQTILRCEDGTETVLPSVDDGTGPIDGGGDDDVVPDEFTQDELTAEEEAEVEVLRTAIEHGLDVGDQEYIDKVTVNLQTAGLMADYEASIEEGWSNTDETVSLCPFVEHYANGFQPNGVNCDFLVELARLDAYASLTEALSNTPLPDPITNGHFVEEANFWYEQGAVSGIEQRRVMVRGDLRRQAVCSTDPTPNEGSYDKGYTIGSRAMADAFNSWLESNGHTPDYPAMTDPIDVCNMNASALDPAYQDAINNVTTILETTPLCDDYSPPTQQHAVEYSQANIQYEAGVRAGIEAEYALAAVRIFRVIPCNVSDPIVVDLDGDGLEILPVYRGVNFDFYAVGRAQAVAWPSPDDGLLVFDRGSDGAITSGAELFGNIDQTFSDGFAQLATLDSDGDGALTAADEAWSSLAVWRDANSDGVTQDGELLSMTDVGLTAIPVEGAPVSMRSGDTRIPAAATAQSVHGDVLIGDALLQTAPYASPSL